jgi:hypothetical protein
MFELEPPRLELDESCVLAHRLGLRGARLRLRSVDLGPPGARPAAGRRGEEYE